MNLFYSSFSRTANLFFTPLCSIEEAEFIFSYVKLLKGNLVLFEKDFHFEKLKANDVLYIPEFDNEILQEALKWSIQTQVIGRMNPKQKMEASNSGLVSFWDLNQNSIQTLCKGFFQNIISPFPIDALVWTENQKFNHRMKSLCERFSIDLVSTENPNVALIALKEQKIDLLVLDWDSCGLEPIQIIKEFRNIKQTRKYFPKVLGIKDFTKMNLFKDLTLGIKDFCPVLFNPTEIIELLSDSLPVGREDFKGEVSFKDKPYLKLNRGKELFQLQFIYPDEKEFKKEVYALSEHEIGFQIFKKQFTWLSEIEE
jgi:CheY-like chemotaxis protein